MTEQEAIEFCKNDPESAAKIILMVERLEKRIKELEAKLNMNSSNSSKPPSTDDKLAKDRTKSTSKSKKKRGAQVATPDETEVLLPIICN